MHTMNVNQRVSYSFHIRVFLYFLNWLTSNEHNGFELHLFNQIVADFFCYGYTQSSLLITILTFSFWTWKVFDLKTLTMDIFLHRRRLAFRYFLEYCSAFKQ